MLNSVYNYRRVPAVVLLKQLIDEGKLGRIFHYRAKFLQDWTISQDPSAGRRRALAARRLGCRERRDRRSARALHRHGDVAQWSHRRRDRSDGDLHQDAHAQSDRKSRTGRNRRRLRLHVAVPQWIAGHFESTRYARGHKALYTLEINGEHASAAGSARPPSSAVVRSSRRGTPRDGAAFTSPTAIIPT